MPDPDPNVFGSHSDPDLVPNEDRKQDQELNRFGSTTLSPSASWRDRRWCEKISLPKPLRRWRMEWDAQNSFLNPSHVHDGDFLWWGKKERRIHREAVVLHNLSIHYIFLSFHWGVCVLFYCLQSRVLVTYLFVELQGDVLLIST